MAKETKHVGKIVNTGEKVAVVFRTVPGESNMALVLPTSTLKDEIGAPRRRRSARRARRAARSSTTATRAGARPRGDGPGRGTPSRTSGSCRRR